MFDKLFDLPKISSSIQQEVTSKIGEATQKIGTSLVSPAVTKIASGLPSFSDLASSNILGKPVSPLLGDLSAQMGSVASQLSGLAGGFGNIAANPFGLADVFGNSSTSLTASALRSTVGEPADGSTDQSHKVRLVSQVDGSAVYFDNMPEIQETRLAEYEALQPPQLPGEFQKYKGTKSVQWTITAVLTAATINEATLNRYYVNSLRTWTYPYFGDAQQALGRLGAPPPVILFSGWRGLVGEVPTVITNLNWTWPKDVDWLPTQEIDPQSGMPIPFPAVVTITITLVESFSPSQINNISLANYRAGDMVGAYVGSFQTIDTGEPSDVFSDIQGGFMTDLSGLTNNLSSMIPTTINNITGNIGAGVLPNLSTIGNMGFSTGNMGFSTGNIGAGVLPNLSTNGIVPSIPGLSGASSLPAINDLGNTVNTTSLIATPQISNLPRVTSSSNGQNSIIGAASTFLSSSAQTAVNLAAGASFKLNQSLYSGTASSDLTYTGSDPLVWDRVNSERLRRGLSGLPNPRP